MSSTYELAIINGTCVVDDGSGQLTEQQVDVGIADGKIAFIGKIPEHKAERVLKADGLYVLPGMIDSQVHFREPGMEHKEDLSSGTASAVLGGITAVFDMPNTKPATTSALDFKDKMTRASGRTWCDYAFYVGASAQNVERLKDLERLPGCCGIKIFMGSSTGDLLVPEDELIEAVLSSTSRNVAVHAEDDQRLRRRKQILEEQPGRVELHPVWRDEETALQATQRLVQIAKRLKRRVHVLHVTTRQEMEFLKDHKDLVSVECTPQHLTLSAPECYTKLGTLAQMNPPIRGEEHRQALWKALADGVVDVLGSDHAPHTLEEKNKPYPESPSGMPGVQTTLPVMLNHVHLGHLTLIQLVKLMATNPARLFHLKSKGRLTVGYDADITLVDLKAEKTITRAWSQSRCGWTPFDGMKVTGWPISTIIRGHIVMRDDCILGSPVGRAIEFTDI